MRRISNVIHGKVRFVAKDTRNKKMVPVWSSLDYFVHPAAQGARNATLTVTDTGLSSPQTASLTGTGTAPTLKSISVTPNPASVTVALTQQLAATGTYSDGSTQNLTTSASWSSSSNAIATVGIHTGLAKGVSAGTATITATSGAVNGTATLTVTAATLTSISVAPANASIPAGKTKQFTATGIYNNGTTQNITSSVTWTSSATSVATVSAGVATGVATGTATITLLRARSTVLQRQLRHGVRRHSMSPQSATVEA